MYTKYAFIDYSQSGPPCDYSQSGPRWNFDLESHRGIAVLVASNYEQNEDPEQHLKEAVNDVQEMKKVFQKATFNYDVVSLLNNEANRDLILALMKQLSDYLKNYVGEVKEKTLVFAFAGHGNSGDMLCTDEGRVTGILSLEDVMEYFVDHACLQDIPKLFFIDACRGRQVIIRADNPAPKYKVGNFLIARSTILNFVSYDINSWMRKLAKKISDDSSKYLALILDELTDDVRNIAQGNARQPEYVSRLWGSFKFTP